MGVNGAGKSTLVKSLNGDIDLLDGMKREGKNLVVGYFSQHQVDDLDLQKSAIQHIQSIDEKAFSSILWICWMALFCKSRSSTWCWEK